jgi:hypothetical protein
MFLWASAIVSKHYSVEFAWKADLLADVILRMEVIE